jgi:N utilization substance protein B
VAAEGGWEAAGGPRPRGHGPRHRARELAMQAIYARDVGLARPLDVLAHLAEEEAVPPAVRALAEELVRGVTEHLAEVDRRIAAYARQWSLGRLAAVDRSILRVAVYELCYRPEVPASVAIDEAVGLADAYGGEDSPRFVNGILGQLARDLEAGRVSG